MLAGVGGRVVGDRRRGVRVRDGDPDALAGAGARAVRGPQLLAGVALDHVRDLRAVRLRQRARGLRAVVRGERPGVAEHGVRRRQLVVVRDHVRGVVQAGDRQHGVGQARRHGGGARRGAVRLRALGEVVQLGAERLLRGGHVTGDGDVVRRDAGDLQAGRRQPGLHGRHLGLGRAEARLRLLGGQVLAVRGRRRVGDGLGVRGEAGRVAAPEIDPGRHPGAVGGGALVGPGRGPRGLGPGEQVAERVVGGVRRGYAERQRAREHRQCRRHAQPGAHLGAVGSHGTPCAVRREWITRRSPLSRRTVHARGMRTPRSALRSPRRAQEAATEAM